jgi:hypothetical protein
MAGVFISLGGKEREMRFSFLSFKALEQHYNKPAQKVFEEEMTSGRIIGYRSNHMGMFTQGKINGWQG